MRSLRTPSVCLLSLVLTLGLVASRAAAQEEARVPSCGEELARRGDYEAAVAPMMRCLELAPRMSTAFNLAIVLRNAGQARRALSLLREIEAGRYGEVPAARREALAAQTEATLASLATIVVTMPAATGAGVVEIDGLEAETLEVGASVTFHVDPGEHAITARGDVCADRAVVSVSRGARREVALALGPCSGAASAEAVRPSPDMAAPGDDGVLIGVAVGVGIALVAGAIVLGVVLGSGTDQPSCTGGRPCIETLVATEPLLRF